MRSSLGVTSKMCLRRVRESRPSAQWQERWHRSMTPYRFSYRGKVGGTLLLKEIWAFHQGEAVKRGIPKSAKKLWDEILPPEMQQKIAEWKEGYKLADKIRVPRCLKGQEQRGARATNCGASATRARRPLVQWFT